MKFLWIILACLMLCGVASATTIADNWSRVTDSAPMQFRWASDATVLNNVIYMYGGDWENNRVSSEVWGYDGTTFTLKNASAAPGPRHGASLATFLNSIVVISGYGGAGPIYYQDTWNSTDGVNWTRTNETGSFTDTVRPTVINFSGYLYVIGGADGSTGVFSNDVYRTPNLTGYETVNLSPAFSERQGAGGCVYDGKMWLMGGTNATSNKNDVWYTTDGNIWTQATASAAWPARYALKPVVADNKMWVIGGYESIAGALYYNDIWYSTNGADWTQVTPTSDIFQKIAEASVIVLNNDIYVIGGVSPATTVNTRYTYSTNAVWKTVTSTPTWLTGSSYRQSNIVNSTLVNRAVPVNYTVFSGVGTSASNNIYLQNHSNSNFSDVRFTDAYMNPLDFWHYTINATTEQYWVELINTTASQTVYCYYNNTSTSDLSNGTNTFSFFDSFGGASVNNTTSARWNQWTVAGAGTATVTGGILSLSNANIRSVYYYPVNTSMVANASFDANNKYWDLVFYSTSPSLYNGYDVNYYTAGQLSAREENAAGGVTSALGTSYANAFHIYNIWRNGVTSDLFWIDSGSVTTLNSKKYDGIQTVFYSAESLGKADWILVRNIVNPMPTFGAWGAEENATTVVTPVANFTANATSGTSPLNVSFTDTSTETPTSWYWEFGDSNTSTSQNPTHVYYTGNWSVNFSATNAAGTDWLNGTWINVTAGVTIPDANFSVNTSSGAQPLSVQFNDTSTNTPTSWFYDFGDGNNTTDQNPAHIYSTGNWSVNMSATNAAGTDWFNGTYINVTSGVVAPVASFTSNLTIGKAPLTIQFTDGSTNTPTSWLWQWGDGTANTTTQSPVHTFTAVGVYQVNLTATNSAGSNLSANTAITAQALAPPIAAFGANATTGYPGDSFLFTDSSTESPTSWEWYFGDSTANATTQNPVHTYSNVGTYSVTLTATNADGSDSYMRSNYITISNVPTPPTAAFSGTPTTGTVPQTVTFTDASTNSPTDWLWQFGDSNTSTLQSPTHTYYVAGTYDVKLYVENGDGNDWENKTGYLVFTNPATPTPTPTPTPATSPPACSFRSNITGAPSYPCTVQFNQTCTGNPTSFNWSFGDGTTSTEENPNHTYTDQGYFTVYLNATNAFGTGETQKENYFHIIQHYVRPTVSTTIAPIGTRGYGLILDSFGGNKSPANETEAKTNWTMLAFGSVAPFMDTLGPLFPLLIIAIPFILIWLATRDLTLPCIVGILICPFLIVMLPSQWHIIAAIGIGLGITAVIYTILTRRE